MAQPTGWASPRPRAPSSEALDFLYVCYDNEGYANTGQQASAATPLGARTASSTTAAGHPAQKKDLFSIWAAHRPAYVATLIGAEPLDLARKIEKAARIEGPRLDDRARTLPHRVGVRPEGHRGDRTSCGAQRRLAAQGVRGRKGRSIRRSRARASPSRSTWRGRVASRTSSRPSETTPSCARSSAGWTPTGRGSAEGRSLAAACPPFTRAAVPPRRSGPRLRRSGTRPPRPRPRRSCGTDRAPSSRRFLR